MNLSPILPLSLRLFASNKVSQLRRRILGRNIEALLINSYNGLFLVDVQDQAVGRDLIRSGEYAREEVERLLSYTKKTTTVLVVGGHIGTIVVPLAKNCQSVTAIEANPRTFKLLKLNLLINGCVNVDAMNVAANDKQEELQFLLSRTNSGGSKRMPLVRDYMYFSDSPEVIKIQSTRLDELLCGSQFDVIVMDIEGSEYFALRGMQGLLASANLLSIEFIPHHLRNVSGITVAQFLEQVDPHFTKMLIPTKDVTVSKDRFHTLLQEMYERDESDSSLIFMK
ncbi:MAG: FkbM family methyltransferase [Candidatus Sulfotelmatobacter sp.]